MVSWSSCHNTPSPPPPPPPHSFLHRNLQISCRAWRSNNFLEWKEIYKLARLNIYCLNIVQCKHCHLQKRPGVHCLIWSLLKERREHCMDWKKSILIGFHLQKAFHRRVAHCATQYKTRIKCAATCKHSAHILLNILIIKYSEFIGDRPHKMWFPHLLPIFNFLHTFCCQLLQIIKLVFMCSFCWFLVCSFNFVQDPNVQNLQSERCVEAGVHFSHFCESPENRWSLTYLHPTGSLWT